MLKEKIINNLTDKNLDNLKAILSTAEEMEILYIFGDLSDDEQVIIFRLLGKDTALSLFEQLDTDLQQNLLHSFTDEKTIEFVNELAPDDRVRLLDELPASIAKKLVASLTPQERDATNILMGYEPETAGRIMTTEFISLKKEMTATQALSKVRAQGRDKETVYTLYVTDNAKKLEGVLSLKTLIMAEENITVADIMTKSVIKAHTNSDQEVVANLLKEFDLLAIPVVDKEDRLVGIVTIDDAVDILEDEATEDIFNEAGLVDIAGKEADRSEALVNGSLWTIWRVRLPFLIITLGAGFAAGLIIGGFEETLESIAVVAIFIPLIMDMGGNVGTQSSTVFARGVVLGHIDIGKFFKHLLKELSVGLSIGALVGVVGGFLTALWQGPELGLAVGLALVATITLAALLGFLVPFGLIKLKVDQAAGSAPIITSIKDIAGLLIYFAFVSLFMGI